MIVVIKETRGKKFEIWNGVKWVDSKDRDQAKRYDVQSSDFCFGEPFPAVRKGEKVGLVQVDCRQKWRMLGVPSPEETMAAVCYDKELRQRTCPNVALVLKDDVKVHGVVLVPRAALEQHPELLERLRREAQELYNQVVVLEDWPVLLEPQGLEGWLRECNPREDEPVPWEEAAKWAISGMLDRLEWRTASGSVVVSREGEPGEPVSVECTSLNELLAELEGAGQQAWGGEVPVDGGGEVFEMAKAISVHDMLFERCGEELKEIGWG